ncbi:MAG: hypothetical protein FJ263_11420 [Planctomycetes bacterium]|nr:hypothetical protein [Planctomycetota bacterium]
MDNITLPYGVNDVTSIDGMCPINGCNMRISEYPTKMNYCPVHKIYCHRVTYVYKNKSDNLIIDLDLFNNIYEKPGNKKFDVNNIGHENSEDALTWNVFATLRKTGFLKNIVSLISGNICSEEPELILWGYSLNDNSFMKELSSFHVRYESELRVKTEPDIILKTKNIIILIEAKFCSSNSQKDISVWNDKEIDSQSKRVYAPYIKRYHGSFSDIFDVEYIERQSKFYSQLVRYVLFSHHICKDYGYKGEVYVVNLLRNKHKEIKTIETEFKPYLKNDIFKAITWEDIYGSLAKISNVPEIVILKKYLEEKTANLRKAFDFSSI